MERMVTEAVHELCHTFNLRHCRDPLCVMYSGRKVKAVDRRTGALCRYCSIMLENRLNPFSAGELPLMGAEQGYHEHSFVNIR